MKAYLYIFLIFTAAGFSSCDSLTREVEVELPPFESQLILEAYFFQDTAVQVSLMETKDYFKEIDTPFIDDAIVTLSYKGKTDTLISSPQINPFTFKYYNYRSKNSIHLEKGELYTITAYDKAGRTAMGSATWIEPVKIDSVVIRKPSEKYNALCYFRDPAGKDYYRFRVRRLGLLSPTDSLRIDYFSNDELFENQGNTFGTGPNYEKGDWLEVALFHLTEDHYHFLNTVSAAYNANGNPFAQPAAIKSNVTGGIGIVTFISFDTKIVRVE